MESAKFFQSSCFFLWPPQYNQRIELLRLKNKWLHIHPWLYSSSRRVGRSELLSHLHSSHFPLTLAKHPRVLSMLFSSWLVSKLKTKQEANPSLSSSLGSLCVLKGEGMKRAGQDGHQLCPVAHFLFQLTHAMDHCNAPNSKTKMFVTLYLQTSIALLFVLFWKLHSL